MSGQTNAEKGRRYGKVIGEYVNKRYGIVGELRYDMKHKIWTITIGDEAVSGDTQGEVEKAIAVRLEELSKVQWYKVIKVEFSTAPSHYNRGINASVRVAATRNVVAEMPNGEFRYLSLKSSSWNTPPEVTEAQLFDPSYVVTHEFAMSQSYGSYDLLHCKLDALPHTRNSRFHGNDRVVYLTYTPDLWEKLTYMCDTINKAREQIVRLLSLDEELGYPPLLDTAIKSMLLSSGDEDV